MHVSRHFPMMIYYVVVFLNQTMAIMSQLPITHKCAIQAMVAAFMNIISQLAAIPSLCQYVSQVGEMDGRVSLKIL